MLKIIDAIKKGRERGASDADILEEIISSNPNKMDLFKIARDRGASDSEIIEKIIEDNQKRIEKEKKKERKDIERKRVEEQSLLIEEVAEEEEIEIDDTKFSGKVQLFNKKIKKLVADFKNSKLVGDIFFSNPYLVIGVDISDHSIEILLLGKDKSITSYNRNILEDNVIENGEIVDQKRLSEILRETLKHAKPQPLDVPEHARKKGLSILEPRDYRAIISLPDSKTYIQVFSFEKRGDLYNQIKDKIKTTIPLDFEEIYWDFVELPSKEGVKVLWVGALRDVVDGYVYFFKSTNIDPIVFEVEGMSIARSLLPSNSSSENMIIDIGAKVAGLNIYNSEGSLAVSVSLPYGGYYFTKKVAEELKISKLDAEDLKQQEGFKKGSKIYKILEKQGDKIIEEIRKIDRYYRKEFGKEVKKITLSGGTSLLPEIVNFFNEKLEEKEVVLGDPLEKLTSGTFKSKKNGVLYANVIGLSLRSSIQEGVNLLPQEAKAEVNKNQNGNNKFSVGAIILFAILVIILLAVVLYIFFQPGK